MPWYTFGFMARVAAVVLLTLMCLDLGMDLWHGETSEFAATENTTTHYAAPTSLSISGGFQQSGTEDSSHECFCCCSHLEQQGPVIVSLILESTPSYSDFSTRSAEPDLVHIYPPPKQII
jgi:hypothetical protein